MTDRRQKELSKAARQIQVADNRMWVALKQQYSMAEQFCALDFQSTVLFEPFAGSFVTTQWAAAQYGWTNSQPLDLIDGYDLLTAYGLKLVHNVLDERRPYLTLIAFDCKFWSLLTNMSPSCNWEELRSSNLEARRVNLFEAIPTWQILFGGEPGRQLSLGFRTNLGTVDRGS